MSSHRSVAPARRGPKMSPPPVLTVLPLREVAFLLALIVGLSPLAASAEVMGRIPSGWGGDSRVAISGNGRFVLGTEWAVGVACHGVAGPTGMEVNVFAYDLATSQFDCVSVDNAGVARAGHTTGAAI